MSISLARLKHPTAPVLLRSIARLLRRPAHRKAGMTSCRDKKAGRDGGPDSGRKRGVALAAGPAEKGGAKRARAAPEASSRPLKAAEAHADGAAGPGGGTATKLGPESGSQVRARIVGAITQELNIAEARVRAAVQLLDDGNTLPFIARYRKEATGCLDEVQLRQVASRMEALDALEARRKTIIQTLTDQAWPRRAPYRFHSFLFLGLNPFTPLPVYLGNRAALMASLHSHTPVTWSAPQGVYSGKLRSDVEAAATAQRLEDLYLPHRPKRSTRSTAARDKGLAPLAALLLAPTSGLPPAVIAKQFVSADVASPEAALAGARDILAEQVYWHPACPPPSPSACTYR